MKKTTDPFRPLTATEWKEMTRLVKMDEKTEWGYEAPHVRMCAEEDYGRFVMTLIRMVLEVAPQTTLELVKSPAPKPAPRKPKELKDEVANARRKRYGVAYWRKPKP